MVETSSSEIDLIRLMVLFLSAGSVVAGSLAILTLASYGFDEATNYSIVSAALTLILGIAGIPLLMAAYRTVKDPDIVAPSWVFVIGIAYLVSLETLYVQNLFNRGESSPLIAAFSLSLVYGLWMFTRLMVRHNR